MKDIESQSTAKRAVHGGFKESQTTVGCQSGFHGAHVTGGILMNAPTLFRTVKGHFTARRHLAFEAASIYWHFVDVVWIGLFTTIYIVG